MVSVVEVLNLIKFYWEEMTTVFCKNLIVKINIFSSKETHVLFICWITKRLHEEWFGGDLRVMNVYFAEE